MRNYELIDFHAHLVSPEELKRICPDAQKSAFFRYIVPAIEKIAQISEPVHYRVLRYLAMHFNDPLSLLAWAYCGELGLMETLRLFKTYDLTRLLKSMEKNKISRTVIYSIEPITRTCELLELTKDYRDRLLVFASCSADMEDPAGYLEPFLKRKDVRGLKLHPIVGGYFGHELLPATKDMLALACEYDVPVSIHTGHIPVDRLAGLEDLTDIPNLEPLIKAFPDCTFILNHIGWESWRKAIDLACNNKNVFVETSWQSPRVIRRAVDKLGAHRVIFGSDFPLFQQWQALELLREALTMKEYFQITSANAMRLLKLEPRSADSQIQLVR